MQQHQRPYVRILALNGGGARCWSALIILDQVMKAVQPGLENPLPCDYFHLIVGSEWGAVIAILLGRMRLSIAVCFERLRELTFPYRGAFLRTLPGLAGLRSRHYKQQFQEWVRKVSPESDGQLPFYDPDLQNDQALTLVLATDPETLETPVLFRSYLRGGSFTMPDADTPIWKIALAAITTPLDLNPVQFHGSSGGQNYNCIASSLAGLSNPSWRGLVEARERFLPNSVHTVLNIGCGGQFKANWPAQLNHILLVFRGMALTKMVIGQVNDAKRTTARMGSRGQMLEESVNTSLYYQYFSASTVDRSYYDWSEKTRRQIGIRTFQYLEGEDICGQVKAVAKKLVKLRNLPVNRIETRDLHDTGPSSRSWFTDFEERTLSVIYRFDRAGDQVKLAILDTGIDARHPYIERHWRRPVSIPAFYDFTTSTGPDGADPVDTIGHGTQMAGLVIERAPHVELYVIRVFADREFEGQKGSDAMEQVRKVNIISMSFAFEGRKRDDLDSAITEAMEKNVVMLAAASNSGHRRENPYPASDRRVFRVNAVDNNGHSMGCNPPAGIDDNNDNLATLGVNLLCPWPANLPGGLEMECREVSWKAASGTSSATALLSAICALTMDFGRVLRAKREFRPASLELQTQLREIWRYVDRPQGMRHLLWQMAGGRHHRTWEQFSYVCRWYLISTDKMSTQEDVSEIGKLYLDALRLGREEMG